MIFSKTRTSTWFFSTWKLPDTDFSIVSLLAHEIFEYLRFGLGSCTVWHVSGYHLALWNAALFIKVGFGFESKGRVLCLCQVASYSDTFSTIGIKAKMNIFFFSVRIRQKLLKRKKSHRIFFLFLIFVNFPTFSCEFFNMSRWIKKEN